MRLCYTKTEIDYIKKELYFDNEESQVLDLWLLNCSIIETSIKLNISTATVSRRRKAILKKLELVSNDTKLIERR